MLSSLLLYHNHQRYNATEKANESFNMLELPLP